jgi:hypothetical protein
MMSNSTRRRGIKNLSRSGIVKSIAWLGILCLRSDCLATTVVTLVTTHGVVVCADGKAIHERNPRQGRRTPLEPSYPEKAVLIKNRFAVSHNGLRSLFKNSPYSVERIFGELERDVSPSFTVSKVADLIRDKLNAEFAGFDVLLKSGRFGREQMPPPQDVITRFNVAGYDGPVAHIYTITIGVDWNALVVSPAVVESVYPQRARNNLTPYIVGSVVGISELFNINSATYGREHKSMPVEIEALAMDRDLDVPGMGRLAHRMVALEIESNPQTVGYPIKVITIPKGGRATNQTYQR